MRPEDVVEKTQKRRGDVVVQTTLRHRQTGIVVHAISPGTEWKEAQANAVRYLHALINSETTNAA